MHSVAKKTEPTPERSSAYFDVAAIVATLPDTAETMLVDTRLTDDPSASSRIFRAYRPVPRHYHATCDEYLHLLSGRTIFEADYGEPRELRPGQMVFFKRGVVHAIPGTLFSWIPNRARSKPSSKATVSLSAG